MLNRDEEEILKSLIKLQEKQNSQHITGAFDDFPVKYQICYKEILERLEKKGVIKDFSDFQGENFVLTLIPANMQEAPKEDTTEKQEEQKKEKKSAITQFDIEKRISVLERIIERKGGKDKKELKGLFEEIREFCENLIENPKIQPRKALIERIIEANAKHPWVYSEAVKIFGVTMVKLLADR